MHTIFWGFLSSFWDTVNMEYGKHAAAMIRKTEIQNNQGMSFLSSSFKTEDKTLRQNRQQNNALFVKLPQL